MKLGIHKVQLSLYVRIGGRYTVQFRQKSGQLGFAYRGACIHRHPQFQRVGLQSFEVDASSDESPVKATVIGRSADDELPEQRSPINLGIDQRRKIPPFCTGQLAVVLT